MAEKSKAPWVIFLLIGCFIILLCCCCSAGLLIAAGSQGTLPDELQEEYDEQDFWDTLDSYQDEYESTLDDTTSDTEDSDSTSTDDSATYTDDDCDFPNGDIEYWWYDVDEAMRECYRDMYGDPWFLEEE